METLSPGEQAIEKKGWIKAHKWLLLRRFSQLLILGLFLLGPLFAVDIFDVWLVSGNLSSSVILGVIPLSDPYVLLQASLSGHTPFINGIIGAVIVLAFYLIVGGRVYCSWVCPVNMVTDASAWFRRKLGLKSTFQFARNTRYWLLGLTLILPAITGMLVWELFNPVSVMFRGIVFGMGWGWMVILSVFIFDLFVSKRGWCGHVCPVGAFYSLLNIKSPVRVSATNRDACDDCMDCFAVCPEPQVIKPALKGASKGLGPIILENNCTNCGRCIDICDEDVFNFTLLYLKPRTKK
ncbi:MAG: quinol dehydrogenase ferredoxin subunit NapH [Pseudomonadota bacterium]